MLSKTVFLLSFVPSISAFAVELPKLIEVEAQERPLYEVGVFIANLYLPDYPASDRAQWRTFPVPSFRLRGKMFRADEEDGARARLLYKRRWDVDVSAVVSFPSNSDKNDARSGMEDLDWVGEVGPRLIYNFHEERDVQRWKAGLPLRGVVSSDFRSAHHLGYVLAPSVRYQRFNFFRDRWQFMTDVTVNFISRGVAEYFYSVRPQDAKADRPAYSARGGYLGTDITIGTEFRFGQFEIISALRAGFFRGSVNEESPLHRADVNWTGIVGLNWLFFQSKEKGYR